MGRPSLRFAHLRSVVAALAIASSACEKKAPPDPRVLQGYALLRSDASAALREFEGAREPGRIDALLGRGLALEGLRRYGEAKEVLARGAKSGDADVLFALTRVELMLGNADAARALVDQVVQKSPTNRAVLLLEGILASDVVRARASLGRLDAWFETLRSSSDPPDLAPAEFHLIRASLHAQLGDADARSRDLSSARKRWFTSADDALSLAVLATAATKPDLAASFLEKLLPGELGERQRLQAAQLAFRLGRLALTRDALLALPSGTPDTIQLRARYDFATRSPSAAASLARALTSTDHAETRIEFALALAETHLREGRIEDAKKATESLLVERPEARGGKWSSRASTSPPATPRPHSLASSRSFSSIRRQASGNSRRLPTWALSVARRPGRS